MDQKNKKVIVKVSESECVIKKFNAQNYEELTAYGPGDIITMMLLLLVRLGPMGGQEGSHANNNMQLDMDTEDLNNGKDKTDDAPRMEAPKMGMSYLQKNALSFGH